MVKRVAKSSDLEKSKLTRSNFKRGELNDLFVDMKGAWLRLNRHYKSNPDIAKMDVTKIKSRAGSMKELGDDKYVEIADAVSRDIRRGVYSSGKYESDFQDYGPKDGAAKGALYSLAFVSFALGGLMLFGNFTGNVVGGVWDGEVNVLGAVLVSLGAVGALVLSRRM